MGETTMSCYEVMVLQECCVNLIVFTLQFLKLEEVSEQIRLHQWQIEHRESFLAVMLHHTVAHEEEGGGASLSDGVISDMIVEPFRA